VKPLRVGDIPTAALTGSTPGRSLFLAITLGGILVVVLEARCLISLSEGDKEEEWGMEYLR